MATEYGVEIAETPFRKGAFSYPARVDEGPPSPASDLQEFGQRLDGA